jgi:hypothetical protein
MENKMRKTIRYRVALFIDDYTHTHLYTQTADCEVEAKVQEKDENFIKWMTDWAEEDVEI